MEHWCKIENYENYEVSSEGQVRNVTTGKMLKPGLAQGYEIVCLYKNGKHKLFKVHRLVAEAFIPKSEGMTCVNHKDEDKTNNNVDNLEWCTQKYNCNHGTRNKRIGEALKGKSHAPHSEETRQKMSEAKKGKPRKPFSEEWKQKISAALKGNQKLSEAMKGNQYFKGHQHSESTKLKMSEARKHYWQNKKQ